MAKHYGTAVSITGTPICDKCGRVLTYSKDDCPVADE